MDHESGDGGGDGGSAPTTLAHVLLILKFLPRKFCHSLVSFTSVPQTSRLLITCTELYTAEKVILQKLPTVCNMKRGCNEFKLYSAMVGTPDSRWLEWLDTSGVEELKLPQRVTDEEMLIMFDAAGGLSFDGKGGGGGGGGGGEREGGKRFSKLRTLYLRYCYSITDASVMEVARRCSNLQSLTLHECWNITDASVLEVARRCPNLQTLNLEDIFNITSACKNALLRQSHPKLQLSCQLY